MKLNDLAQLVAAIAVLIGLGLVVWELQQTKALTFLQVIHGNMNEVSQDRQGIYGEDLNATLSVACFHPDSLTTEQAFILDAYFENQSIRAVRYSTQVSVAGFSTNWHALTSGHIRKILSFPQGKRWIQNHRMQDSRAFPEVRAFVNKLLEQEVQSCKSTIGDLLQPNQQTG